MEEPINKRLFEKYLKDESGLKDSSSDWEMSPSSVSEVRKDSQDLAYLSQEACQDGAGPCGRF